LARFTYIKTFVNFTVAVIIDPITNLNIARTATFYT